jgi:hypothetical protein
MAVTTTDEGYRQLRACLELKACERRRFKPDESVLGDREQVLGEHIRPPVRSELVGPSDCRPTRHGAIASTPIAGRVHHRPWRDRAVFQERRRGGGRLHEVNTEERLVKLVGSLSRSLDPIEMPEQGRLGPPLLIERREPSVEGRRPVRLAPHKGRRPREVSPVMPLGAHQRVVVNVESGGVVQTHVPLWLDRIPTAAASSTTYRLDFPPLDGCADREGANLWTAGIRLGTDVDTVGQRADARRRRGAFIEDGNRSLGRTGVRDRGWDRRRD